MPDATLLMLVEEVRGKTLRRLEGVTPAEAAWAPTGTQNTILWHAGHAFVIVEWLSSQGLGCEPAWPPGWRAIFGKDSQPAQVAAEQWPKLEEVVARLVEQRERLRSAISALSEAELDRAVADGSGRTPRYLILHGLHDEACHSGEIWLLRKMWRRIASAPDLTL
ncbi:MAG: hypothetical protein KatS3mg108_0318 [Isosphaeraceae bacterium]|jgi:hypothetical protein|nr:MAG: hypothetical protein KatS3mg108_0318 [Isosphaeraceae bacterium]